MRCTGGRQSRWLCVPGTLNVGSERRQEWGAEAGPCKVPEAVLRNLMCPEQGERRVT